MPPGGLEAGGCSEPCKWGAYEDWKAGGLSGKETLGMEEAAEAEALGLRNGQREVKYEGDRREEKIQVERMGGVH